MIDALRMTIVSVVLKIGAALFSKMERPLARAIFALLHRLAKLTTNDIDDEWVIAGERAYFKSK